MGTSYGIGPSGRWVLSCDECGRSDGTVRKVRCPFGYCYRAHLCQDCRAPGSALSARLGAPWGSRSYHLITGCDAKMATAETERQHERDLAAAGRFIRHAAQYTDAVDPTTGERLDQVVFAAAPAGEAGPERWVLMRGTTYNAIPIGETATIEDYAAHGPVVAGPVGWQGWRACSVDDVLRAWAEGRPPETAAAPAGSSKGVAVA